MRSQVLIRSDYLLALFFLSLLCPCVLSKVATASKGAGSKKGSAKLEAYKEAINIVSDNINKATEKSEALIKKHMSAVDKDPGSLITKEAMQKLVQGNTFLPQKAGTRSIQVESQQGFNGISNYQPAGWKITETMSGPTDKKQEPTSENHPVYTYPLGLGPVLLNGCTGNNYSSSSPCYNSKQVNIDKNLCTNIMDSANYIGVGFDGRGFYRAESRKASLIQRSCANKGTFLGQDVPDTMNVFGIFETTAETKSFQSVDQYMKYIRDKAGLSNQKNLFTSEASKFSKASSFGINLGGIGAIVGGAIGAVAGGPVGATLGATIGGAIGGSIGGGKGSGSGRESSTQKGKSSSKMDQSDKSSAKQGSTQSFFSVMYVNVVLYDITLDDVKPTDINLAALKDLMSLPVSYYSIGASVKYQNFVLRWGTHFIRSAKFGGQLKVTKTAKTDKFRSQQEFASVAETEFQSMFATLQSKYSQESSSWGFLGIGGESKSSSQTSSAKSESSYTSTMNAQNKKSQAFRQSEFTQTTVEAQGGTPEIAEALVDFYTPAFKQLFHDWLVSIKDYAKPFEFQLRPINELLDMNMDSLFPAGNLDFGCVGDGSGKVTILVDPKTKKRYYMETRTVLKNNVKINTKVRVDCKYSDIDSFKSDMHARMLSLEKAVAIYMAEGPFPTSSLELKGGEPGCEEKTVAKFRLFGKGPAPLKFAELMTQPFLIEFELPESIPNIATMRAKFVMTYRFDRWFAVEPNEELVHLYDGCQIANFKSTDKKVCFRNIILIYEEKSGLFTVDKASFAESKLRIPSLPYWLAGTTVARSRKMSLTSKGASKSGINRPQRAAVPCNVKWRNSHRLDPRKDENCLHFTAASEGDLFVIFASIPKDHATWYYLQITLGGVNFYQAMSLHKSDRRKGMGILGDKNLFQSFFVCVIQKANAVTMQYGKTDPESDVGSVHAAYTFPTESQFSRLSFYTFGSGTKPASLMDIRQTKSMPVVSCLSKDYTKKNGICMMVCHDECNGCRQARDNTMCQMCKNFRIETGSGSSKITKCVAKCPPGMYLSNSKKSLCIPCAAGKFKAAAGSHLCSPCKKGLYSPEGASSCTACLAGTYKKGNSGCVKCPAGKYAMKGASACLFCPAGQFSNAGQSKCNLCPYGRYGSSIGMPKCALAPRGSFVSGKGSKSFSTCPVGTFNNKEGQWASTACRPCAPGTYGDTKGLAVCKPCPVGQYQPNSRQSSCIKASPGYYVNAAGSTSQRLCPAGQFASLGSRTCHKCSDFSYVSSTSEACIDCPNNSLAKSDRLSCYKKVSLTTCFTSGNSVRVDGTKNVCHKAIDKSRKASASDVYISQYYRAKYLAALLPKTNVRKIVLWRRTDCCTDQFIGIQVSVEVNNQKKLCGTVTSADKPYFIIDCNHNSVNRVILSRQGHNWISVAEVEVYAE